MHTQFLLLLAIDTGKYEQANSTQYAINIAMGADVSLSVRETLSEMDAHFSSLTVRVPTKLLPTAFACALLHDFKKATLGGGILP